MAIEQWVIDPQTSSYSVRQLEVGTKVELNPDHLPAPYNQGRNLVQIISSDLIYHCLEDTLNQGMGYIYGFTKENINRAFVGGLRKDGRVELIRWVPLAYGENGEPPSPFRTIELQRLVIKGRNL